jgi:hypothetical protein
MLRRAFSSLGKTLTKSRQMSSQSSPMEEALRTGLVALKPAHLAIKDSSGGCGASFDVRLLLLNRVC